MKIIGLVGTAGAGKDTVAAIIQKYCPTVEQLSFASPIYAMLDVAFPPPPPYQPWREADRWTKDDYPVVNEKSFRFLAQTLGTDWGRNIVGSDVWVQAALGMVKTDAVFSDVRFQNEAQAIRDAGGLLIKIIRPENPHYIGASHASEQEIDLCHYDVVVNNIGSLADLEKTVLHVLQQQKII